MRSYYNVFFFLDIRTRATGLTNSNCRLNQRLKNEMYLKNSIVFLHLENKLKSIESDSSNIKITASKIHKTTATILTQQIRSRLKTQDI
jgi:hypothetical protein